MRITDTDTVANGHASKCVLRAAVSNLDRSQQIQFSISAASANRSSALIHSCCLFENVYKTFYSVTIRNQKLQACVLDGKKITWRGIWCGGISNRRTRHGKSLS